MATRKNNERTQTTKGKPLAAVPATAHRNDSPETAPIVLQSAHILELAMRERGLTDAGLADALKIQQGYSITAENIRQKRRGKSMMSLVQLEEFARVLDIPMVLFIQPVSETKFHFARELAELEALREARENGGRDQGLRDSRWNSGTPACDPEIGATVGASLVGVGV
jgi:transcriptional regulator with XRE-family HTH domain